MSVIIVAILLLQPFYITMTSLYKTKWWKSMGQNLLASDCGQTLSTRLYPHIGV